MRYLSSVILLTTLLGSSSVNYKVGFGQDKAKEPEKSKVESISSETELIAILKSDSPGEDKAMACKRLAIYGSGAAAAELGKLLSDEKLASWSRIALEAIPGKEADETLRSAIDTLSGRLLVGAINSVGFRRDQSAVELLIKQLNQVKDVDVAAAAAVALGRIGGNAASAALRASLNSGTDSVRSAAAEGCVLCAEQFLAGGNATMATAIYDEVRKAKLPTQRVVEATRGAILARGSEGIPLLLEQLRATDKAMFYVGLWMARELPGKEVAAALVAELDKAAPERAALIVTALADRKENLDLPTLIRLASKGHRDVRIAAMSAMSRFGNATCVEPILKIALEKDADLRSPAKEAIAAIPDDAVDKEVIARLPNATGDMQLFLIEVIGQRRIEATSELVKALESSDGSIRKASLEALGSTVPQKKISILIQQVVSPKVADDVAIAKQALETAAIRMPDREVCSAELAAAMTGASIATKSTLLEVLGAVGGEKALKALGEAAKGTDVQLKDVSSRLLGDWMTIDAAPVLLDLASTGPEDKFQVRAMRGYIRIARQFVMPDKARIEMCSKAMDASKQLAEKKLVVEIYSRYPSMGTLKLAIKALENPDLKADATQAAQKIAEKLGDKKEVQDLMKKAGIAKL
ncbi:MAG: HEAT repeat domain-containing protein [Pirellulaceae bacterium]|nr:HEAT repeat domain-containing protein [Pirellulaceae bacterium]